MTTPVHDHRYEQQAQHITLAFAQAHRHVRDTIDMLASNPRDLAALHAAVTGTVQLTRGLVDAVDRLIAQAPTALTPADARITTDLVADLRALRGSLITGAALADPAVNDLSRLTGHLVGSRLEYTMDDHISDVPVEDLLEQQQPTEPDAELERWQEQITFPAVSDADPADVLDQHHPAPLDDDG